MAGQGRAGGYRRGDDGGQESFIACCLHGRPVSYIGFEDPPRAHPQGRRPGRVISRAGERAETEKTRRGRQTPDDDYEEDDAKAQEKVVKVFPPLQRHRRRRRQATTRRL